MSLFDIISLVSTFIRSYSQIVMFSLHSSRLIACLGCLAVSLTSVFGCFSYISMLLLLFIGSVLFWAGFDQGGSSLNLFAKDYTDLYIFGWEPEIVSISWVTFQTR